VLEQFGHGGDLLTAEETFGRKQDQFLDFSSNMNPLGPPAAVKEILQSSWRELSKYPDPAVRELRAKLAVKYDVPIESILVGNGAAELIDLVVRVLKPQAVGLARPSFLEYEEAVHKADSRIVDIPLLAEDRFTLQQRDVDIASKECDLLFLGHPNNPTGKLVPASLLKSIVNSGQRLIVDEAFMDFVSDEPDHSLLREAAYNKQVIVIRSMTKFYSIPGIRLGFMVAHPDTIASIRRLQVPWSVNYLAQRIGAEVLQDRLFEQQTADWMRNEKPWLIAQLEGLGLQVTPSDVNFLLVAFPEESGLQVKQVQKVMGHKGILIRDASLFEGLDQRYCRVAIRLRADNEMLVAALQETMQELRSRGGIQV
jgi:threonine-phosphate decarboxylase